MKTPAILALSLCGALLLGRETFAKPRPEMVTLTGSGATASGKSVGLLKQYGFCDESQYGVSRRSQWERSGMVAVETNETESCQANQWIGLFGLSVVEAVKEDSLASVFAGRLRTASLAKGASMVAIPIFLFSGISMMNADIKDGEGKVDENKSPRPISIAVTAGAGVAFISFVIWSITETSYLTKTRNAWNRGGNASLYLDGKSVGMGYTRSF